MGTSNTAFDIFPVPLICPRCRSWEADRVHMSPLRRQGNVLVCGHRSCGARYPMDPFFAVVNDFGLFAAHLAFVSWDRIHPDAHLTWLESLAADAMMVGATRRFSTHVWADFWDALPAFPPPQGLCTAPRAKLVVDRLGGCDVKLALVSGAGAGRMALEIASHGAKNVVAIDMDPLFVQWMDQLTAQDRAAMVPLPTDAVRWTHAQLHLDNAFHRVRDRLHVLCADAASPPIPAGCVDLLVIPSLLGQIPDPAKVLERSATLLAPGARMVVISDYSPDSQQGRHTQGSSDKDGCFHPIDGPAAVTELLTTRLRCPLKLQSRWSEPWVLRIHGRHYQWFESEVLVFVRE